MLAKLRVEPVEAVTFQETRLQHPRGRQHVNFEPQVDTKDDNKGIPEKKTEGGAKGLIGPLRALKAS